jgi:hypothetical protein
VSVQDITIWNQCLDLQNVDWPTTSLSTLLWNDHVTFRAAQRVWKRLVNVILRKETTAEPNDSEDVDASEQLMIIKQLGGLALLYKCVRAHFFGRDMVDWQPEMHTSTQVVLGRRVTKSQPILTDPPHWVIPSRVAVALNSLKFLNVQHSEKGIGKSPTAFWSSIIDELFPVLASLVDSNRNFEISLGASGFVLLLESIDKAPMSFRELGENGKIFINNVLSLLDMGFKTSEAAATVAVGQAQYCAFRLLQQHEDSIMELEHRNRRQKTTQHWLRELSRFYRPNNGSRRWEILVGGIIPLLSHMAKNHSTADGMEIGRQGLSVLLPLLDQDTMMVDDKTEMAAMMALINLMMAAHPIMPNHGGKILSYLLSAASSAPMDSALQKLAIFAGGVALLICGPKFTNGILSMVQDDQSHFQERLRSSATRIVSLASEIGS